tara:strand:- start:1541 stop:1927 length:387 start_codon:yes stop_codon:yes gene_type:complete
MNSEHFKVGLNKAKLGLHEEAIEEFEKAVWEDPNNFEIHYNLGTAFLTLGGFDQAIISFSNALKINPNNSDALGNRSVAYLAIGDEKRSEKDKISAIKMGAPPDGINTVLEFVREQRKQANTFKSNED